MATETKEREMTIKFYNNNEAFGYGGPFGAESKEALADDMEPTFREWAQSEDWEEDVETIDEWIELKKKEYISGLRAEYYGEPRIIFDNGGGITIQLPGFAHHYDDAKQCADDIAEWLDTEYASDWEGNEEDAVFEPTQNQIANGGYLVMNISELLDMKIREAEAHSWGNVQRMFTALTCALLD